MKWIWLLILFVMMPACAIHAEPPVPTPVHLDAQLLAEDEIALLKIQLDILLQAVEEMSQFNETCIQHNGFLENQIWQQKEALHSCLMRVYKST